MRLDKFLSECTPMSRKEIKAAVKAGKVTVNDAVAKASDMKIDEARDEVFFCGEKTEYKKFIYLMMNKPAGYVSANEDKHYPVVIDLLPEKYRHYNPFCVGRLDIDTEGLLLITNDGEYAHKMTSPKKEVYKKYFVKVKTVLNNEIRLTEPMTLLDGKNDTYITKGSKVEKIDDYSLYLSICEGKFHQVKRMIEAIDNEVIYLKRVAIGKLELPNDLALGDFSEVQDLEF